MRGKLKENEENKGINDKKAYEDQLLAIWNFFGGSLLYYFIPHTLVHLEYSWSILGSLWHTLDLEKEGKRKIGKCKGIGGLAVTTRLLCR